MKQVLRRSSLTRITLIHFLLGLGWAGCGGDGVEAPRPQSIDGLDPAIAAAVVAAAAAVDADPGDADLRTQLGMVYEANGLYELAAFCYEQVLHDDSRNSRVGFRLAACQERLGDLDEAISVLREVVRIDPAAAPAQARLATWLLNAGWIDDATVVHETAAKLDPTMEEVWFVAARIHLARREPEKAIEVVQAHSLSTGPNQGYANGLLATAYRMTGRPDLVAELAERSQGQRPSFSDAWTTELQTYRVGLIHRRSEAVKHLQRGEYQTASGILTEILDNDPDDVRTLNMLAQCQLQSNYLDRALANLLKAKRVDPKNFATRLNMARVILRAANRGEADAQQALNQSELAVGLRPDSGEAHALRGMALHAVGRLDEAVEAYNRAWLLDSRNPMPMVRCGHILLGRGRWLQAMAVYEAILDEHHDLAPALLGRARAAMEQGDLPGAESTLASLSASEVDSRQLAAAWKRLRFLGEKAGSGD